MNKQLENKLDSREVAEMMEIEHKNLIKKIDGINHDLESSKISSLKYWEESTYKVEGQTKNYRNFLITKRGCEFLAHKTTGTKGNLFTDKYMDRFSQMEQVIKNNLPVGMDSIQGMAFLSENMAVIGQGVQALTKFTMGLKEYVQDSIQSKDQQIDEAMNLIGVRRKNVSRLIRKLKDVLFHNYGQYIPATDIRYIAARDRVFKEFKVTKWEEISVVQYNAVEAFIDEVIRED